METDKKARLIFEIPKVDGYFVNPNFFKSNELIKTNINRPTVEEAHWTVIHNGKKYKVFVAELYAILSEMAIPLPDGNTFNGRKFIKDYATGFNKGTDYFNSEFALKIDTLYSSGSSGYVDNLKSCYFKKAPDIQHGWIYWASTYPLIINPTVIEEYGFYAGIINAVNSLRIKHQTLFKDFESNESKSNIKEGPKPRGKAFAIHYVLAYIYDCIVTGVALPVASEKKRLEQICADREIDLAGDTFYRKYREARRIDLNSKKALTKKAGKNWGEMVIYLSKNPDEVYKHLKDKKLV
ncbi:MAG TPA: hypothetical protein PKM27_16950 [Saprospiraceae bacterium]|nr:hypothetical protein [Saprospiraceae bacterium]